MTTMTKRDAISAAMGLAEDVAQGRLAPADLEAQAVAELQALVGTVVGEGDPVWDLQVQIARGVLAAGGIPATELQEWAAVERQRAGEPVEQPDPGETMPEPSSTGRGQLSADSVDADAEVADPEPEPELVAEPQPVTPTPEPTPPRRADEYDPLAAWPPSRSLRRPL